MESLWIVGAGGFGREVYAWATHHPDCGRLWEIAGFLDDRTDALDNYPGDAVVLPIKDYRPRTRDLLICALGMPRVKKEVCEYLMSRGGRFLSLVHPNVVLGRDVALGQGVVLCPGVVLTCDITVGDFAMINCLSSCGHDVRLGAWSTLSGHCDMTGGVELGEGVFAGSGVRVLPGKKAGAWATLGAGSVVTRDVPPGVTVFGNPARKL